MEKQDSVELIPGDRARRVPGTDDSAATITRMIRQANADLDRAAQDVLAGFHTTGASFDVLAALFASGPPYRLTPTELYRGHMMSSAGITARLDVLERAGLAARSRDPRDRRGVLVTLTKTGLKLVKEATHALNRRQAFLLTVYAERERKQVLSLLKQMLSSLERTGPGSTLPVHETATAPWIREFPTMNPWLVEFLIVAALLAGHISRETDRLLRDHDVSQTALFILAALRRSGNGQRLSPGELSQAAALSSAGMTAQLDQLEQRGLLQRSPHPQDRRAIRVTLTRAGQQLVDQALRSYNAGHERMLSALSSGERRELDRLLRKLLTILEMGNGGTRADANGNGRRARVTKNRPRTAGAHHQRIRP